MLSGGKAGLVSVDVLRKEQEENRHREKNNQPLEGWLSFSLLRHFNFISVDSRIHRAFHLISTCTVKFFKYLDTDTISVILPLHTTTMHLK